MSTRTTTAVYMVIIVMASVFGFVLGTQSSYNPDTVGLWVAHYGVELAGPDGIELVQCYWVPDVGFKTVDC